MHYSGSGFIGVPWAHGEDSTNESISCASGYRGLFYFAFGDTIGPSTGCADSVCLGASYTLNVINYTGNQLTVDYIIDGTKFTNGTGTIITGNTDGIFALALNFSVPVTGVSLLSAPGGTGDWKAQTGGQNSSGCDGSGNPFGCAQVTSLGNMPVVGSAETMPYTWRFLLTTDGSALGANTSRPTSTATPEAS